VKGATGQRSPALRYHVSVPRYLLAGALGKRAPVPLAPLRLVSQPPPSPPPGWRGATVRLAGICGSDLALLFGQNSPRLSPFFTFPAVLGHEILAEVDGVRVAVNPTTSCRERGLEPCDACSRGDDHLCANAVEGELAAGMIGYNRDLPGGWGQAIVAHEQRLHAVADHVPDERAVLAEPYAVALRGARFALARAPRRVLVIGGGSIGLLAVVALRTIGFGGALHAIARYPQQRAAAAGLGADHVHADAASARAGAGAKSYAAVIGPPAWRGGGFDAVIDAAGSRSSLDEAAWSASEGGAVVLVGAAGALRHDFSAHWFREVALLGSWVYNAADFAEAVTHLAALAGLERLVTRRYPLRDYREALTDVRRRRVVKAVFDPHA
jgi:threonine dehydrogenase-like Zn-dependent dehydrogenase